MRHAPESAERRAWLRLARTEHVGPVTFASLIARFGSATAALAELPRLVRRGGGQNFAAPPERDSELELERLDDIGGGPPFSLVGGISPPVAPLGPPPPPLPGGRP